MLLQRVRIKRGFAAVCFSSLEAVRNISRRSFAAKMSIVANRREQSSQSNYDAVRVSHLHVDWVVDFVASRLKGTAKYKIVVQVPSAAVVLDTNHLDVTSATVDGVAAAFNLAPAVEPFGRALTVPLNADGSAAVAGAEFAVEVAYTTTEASAALQWLTPEQTAGKSHPYLLSQCQAIHARSLVPCMDTPAVKAPYSGRVIVPAPLAAVMSALPVGEPEAVSAPEGAPAGSAWRAFTFNQPVPTPSYLIAIAAGHIEKRDIGPRSAVWAEPEVVDAAAYEFAETESFLSAAEKIVGPYVWGRYDILCLPPSFPYGGMENPCMTFVTPTLLCGDRSLADVVIHEAVHSWEGNLVSPCAWNHFWLNESWTMMVQRMVMAAVSADASGPTPDAALEFDSISGQGDLADSIAMFESRGQHEFTKLVPDLAGIDPDDSFSSVPYEKGYYHLYTLRQLVGRERFARFVYDYTQTFKFRCISSADFKAYTVAYFSEGRYALPRVSQRGVPPMHTGDSSGFDPADIPALSDPSLGRTFADGELPGTGVEDAAAVAAARADAEAAGLPGIVCGIDWDAWFTAPGMPPLVNKYDTSRRAAVDALAERWLADAKAAAAETPAASAGWAARHWIAFSEKLLELSGELASRGSVIPPATLRAIDAGTQLSTSRNSEIRSAWCQLAVRSGLEESLAAAESFLKAQGRMKYVRPVMRELLRTRLGRPVALRIFREHGAAYHPVCAKMVAVDIERETAKEPLL